MLYRRKRVGTEKRYTVGSTRSVLRHISTLIKNITTLTYVVHNTVALLLQFRSLF